MLGLETPGLMHPHWYSASPEFQKKLVSLFLTSLAADPTNRPSESLFETELYYSRNPHDVVAVLRWAFRHLELECDSLASDGSPGLAWYTSFAESEQAKSYPIDAFDSILLPLIRPVHVDLLMATMELFSSLSAHAEMNSASSSKLSMLFGQNLLTGNVTSNIKDWASFYEQWNKSGRALELVFLSYLRYV